MKQWIPGDPLTESDYELLQPLLDHAAATGMTPTVKEIPTAAKIKSRFRIWKYAVMAAGLQSLNAAEQIWLREAKYQRIRTEQEKKSGEM